MASSLRHSASCFGCFASAEARSRALFLVFLPLTLELVELT